MIPFNDLKIEIDMFHDIYEGVTFAEIEFESEEQGKNIEIPEWFGKEIGDKISNDVMSKKYIDIKKECNI